MKKNILSFYLLFTVVIAAVSFTSCSKEDNPTVGTRISFDELTDLPNKLFIGNEIKLKSTVTSDEDTEKTITWTSNNPSVASVTNGKLTALKEGITTITAQAGNQTAIYAVTVRDLLTFDEGVVINGVKWATRNVDAPGTFTAKPEDAGMFYQINRNVGWSATDPMVNSDGGTTWDNTPIREGWEKANDPCPVGWRLPYHLNSRQFPLFDADLFDADRVSNVWAFVNGVSGRKFTDKGTGNSIFLPAAGYRDSWSGSLYRAGEIGSYYNGAIDVFFDGGTPTVWFGCYYYFDSYFAEVRHLVSTTEVARSVRCIEDTLEIKVNEIPTKLRGNKFYADPVVNGDNQAHIYVLVSPGATIAIDGVQQNPRTVTLSDYGENFFTITVLSLHGPRDYTLIIERYYEKLAYEYPDVPTINCNKQTNGGLTFTSFQWYRAGEVIDEATRPYYQVKDNAVYHCELTTSNNLKMRTINILPQSYTNKAARQRDDSGNNLKNSLLAI